NSAANPIIYGVFSTRICRQLRWVVLCCVLQYLIEKQCASFNTQTHNNKRRLQEKRFRLIRCVLTRLGCCLSDEVDPRRRFYTDPPTTTFTQCTYTTHARTHRTEGDQETALSSVDESKDLCDLVLSTAPSQNLLSTQTCIR
uniref:G-protein coupled receptors family 1 profile domain-containing protein n=1 Tax=Magallana gigas TaxID=29159 RepID=A0A8W8LET1_MAGGI